VGDRADLDGFEKREISCPYSDSNPPTVRPVITGVTLASYWRC